MTKKILRGVEGYGEISEGKILKIDRELSFYSDIDKNGIIISKDLPVFGESIARKILVFPKTSAVDNVDSCGLYSILNLSKNNAVPSGIITYERDQIILIASQQINKPYIVINKNQSSEIKSGYSCKMNGIKKEIEIGEK